MPRDDAYFPPYPVVIYMDGLIGSGKSTLLERVRDTLGPELCAICPEPVKEWQPLLQKFYKDQRRYAFSLQMKVLHSFVSYDTSVKRHGLPRAVNLVERSPATCRYVFGSMLAESGTMCIEEEQTFNDYYDAFFGDKMKIGVYVHASPETCIARKSSRSRAEDKDIDDAYMHSLYAKYSQFIKIDSDAQLRTSGMCWAKSAHFDRIMVVDGSRGPDEVANLAIRAINIMLQ